MRRAQSKRHAGLALLNRCGTNRAGFRRGRVGLFLTRGEQRRGLLIGVLFLKPIIGVALGAASGALGGALTDYGINDSFMKELTSTLKPGNAAMFVLIQELPTKYSRIYRMPAAPS
jgi:Protein of unknown function (DUF1269)